MKIKTSELSGMALCYVVCIIEMPHLVWGDTIGEHHASKQIVVPELREPDCYSPYMNWAMFGPIIEREKIELIPPKDEDDNEWMAVWYKCEDAEAGIQVGTSPLIAAMRCYVASKLGEEVEVPDGIT